MLKPRHFYLLIFCFCIITGQGYGQVNDSISILERSLSGNLPDTLRLNTLVRLADYYISKKATFGTAESYTSRALEFAHHKKLPIPYRLHWINAIILRSHDNPVKAAEEMNIVIAYLEGENRFQEVGEARNYLASVTSWSGQMNHSIDIYLENIRYAREKGLKKIIPNAYLGIAGLYNILKKYKEEKVHLQLSLNEAKNEDSPLLTALAYDRLGRCYSTVDSNFTEAIHFFHESLKIRKLLKDSMQIFGVLNNLGWNFYMAKQQDSSLFYYFQSLQNCPSYHLSGIANIYENVGNIYRDKKEFKNALHYYNVCNDYCLKANDLYNRAWLNKDMSDMYISMGDYKRAYQHFVTFNELNNLLNNRKYDVGLADARAKYETEGKEKELQLLNMKLDQNKYFTYGLAAFIILLLIIGFLLYYQSKMAAKRKITEMNNKLTEITHANLRQQMNPHFIFNTLNSIQYYMYQHDKIATNNYLTKFSRLIRKILENSQQTLVPVKDELDVIQLYLELETLRFKDKFTFEITIDEEIDTLTYKIPTMLIQPYVENAVCHGLINKQETGLLTIKMQLCDHYICCTIEDNGIGREAAMLIKKQKDTLHSSLGTKITESRINITNALYGTDLKVIFTDLNDGENNPCGTRVELQLPLMT